MTVISVERELCKAVDREYLIALESTRVIPIADRVRGVLITNWADTYAYV